MGWLVRVVWVRLGWVFWVWPGWVCQCMVGLVCWVLLGWASRVRNHCGWVGLGWVVCGWAVLGGVWPDVVGQLT